MYFETASGTTMIWYTSYILYIRNIVKMHTKVSDKHFFDNSAFHKQNWQQQPSSWLAATARVTRHRTRACSGLRGVATMTQVSEFRCAVRRAVVVGRDNMIDVASTPPCDRTATTVNEGNNPA